jgi:hypothetical protein
MDRMQTNLNAIPPADPPSFDRLLAQYGLSEPSPRIVGGPVLSGRASAEADLSRRSSAEADDPGPPAPPSAIAPETPDPQPETPNSELAPTLFPRAPGETPRAFGAFLAFFQLGQARSHQALADLLGEKHNTIKCWASKYRWSARLLAFHSGLLQQQAQAEADALRRQAAEWSRRTAPYRELEWAAALKLMTAAECFLENVGDGEIEKMTLSQASRALEIASRLARVALGSALDSPAPALAPIQIELTEALKKAYGQQARPDAADASHAADVLSLATLAQA